MDELVLCDGFIELDGHDLQNVNGGAVTVWTAIGAMLTVRELWNLANEAAYQIGYWVGQNS